MDSDNFNKNTDNGAEPETTGTKPPVDLTQPIQPGQFDATEPVISPAPEQPAMTEEEAVAEMVAVSEEIAGPMNGDDEANTQPGAMKIEVTQPDAVQSDGVKTNETQPDAAQIDAMLNTAKVDKPKKNNKMMLIMVAIAGVLIVILAVVLLMMLSKKPSSGNSSSNSGTTNDSSVSDDTSGDEVIQNTELAAGTVTTTVGGQTITYSAAYLVDGIDATIGSGTYESATDDQAVFVVANGGSLTIQGDVNINKTGSADFAGRGDNYSFYGLNSAIVVVGEGSSVTINGAKITTSVSGANAVVATGGATANVQKTTIDTSNDGSRGLHATYGGTIIADEVAITTRGASSATLATDRGEGVVTASNMTLSTEGAGSPLIYSTGNITVTGSTGTANGAQIAVIEGKNSVTLDDCEFSTNGIGNRNNVDNAAIMIYQSMSGDAAEGVGSFTATNSTLTILPSSSVYTTAPFFFATNTTAEISLTGVKASFYQDGYFILASGTSEWGTEGANGAIVNISMTESDVTNQNIGVDGNSSVVGL